MWVAVSHDAWVRIVTQSTLRPQGYGRSASMRGDSPRCMAIRAREGGSAPNQPLPQLHGQVQRSDQHFCPPGAPDNTCYVKLGAPGLHDLDPQSSTRWAPVLG